MSWDTMAAWGLGAWAGLFLIGYAVTAHRLLRLRQVPVRLEACAEAELSAPVQRLFLRATQELATLGYEPKGLLHMLGPIAGTSAPVLWLRHHDRRSWAWVSTSETPSLGAPLRLALVTTFADGGSLVTLSGEAWALWDRPGRRMVDNCRASWKEMCQDHSQTLVQESSRSVLEQDLSQLIAQTEHESQEQLTYLVPFRAAHGELQSYGFPWWTACRLAAHSVFPSKARRQLRAERARLPPWLPEAPDAMPWLMAQGYRHLEAITSFPVRPGVAWMVFGITLLLFGFSLLSHHAIIAQLTLVLLFHELGHWAAMRFFGYRDPAIFFVPFLGAVTTGTKHEASMGEQLTMLAAGPVPGLLAGILVLQWVPCPSSDLQELANLAIALNGLNLLPISPLDGGRILQLLIAGKRPRLEAAIGMVSVALFFVVGFALAQPALLVIGGMSLLSMRTSYAAARLAVELEVHRGKSGSELVELAFDSLLRTKLSAPGMRQAARIALQRLQAPSTSARQRLLGWGSYVILLATAGSASVPVASARRSSPTPGEASFACTLFVEPFHSPPTGFPRTALQVACEPAEDQDLSQLEADLKLLSMLPGELCLRAPWALLDKDEAVLQERARRTVAVLATEGDKHRTYDYRESDSPEVAEQAFRADWLRAIAAMERWMQAHGHEADFDRESARAYIAYQRTKHEAPTTSIPDSPEPIEPSPEETALAALLGTRSDCEDPTLILRARMSKDGALKVDILGDPRELASHFCAVGCEAVSVRPPKERPTRAP